MFQSHGGFSSLAQDAKELQYKLQRFFAQKGPPPLEAPGAFGVGICWDSSDSKTCGELKSRNAKLVYPLVNIQKTMENHNFWWEFLWSFSIATLNY